MSAPGSATAAVLSNAAQAAVSGLTTGVSAPAAGVLVGTLTTERQCRLVQGIVALSAQLVLLVVVLTALFVKRYEAVPSCMS
jgi:hypothetical protein